MEAIEYKEWLKEGEHFCDECNGVGHFYDKSSAPNIFTYTRPCLKCNTSGKLDWIEEIVGKKSGSVWVKPGVYTREVDLSVMVQEPETLYDESINPIFVDYPVKIFGQKKMR